MRYDVDIDEHMRNESAYTMVIQLDCHSISYSIHEA